jgi:hypothetical protein
MVRGTTRTGGRTVEEATQILWDIIDEATKYMEDPMLTSEERRRWAKTLADTVGVLRRLQASHGEKPLEDEDLGTLLSKVPRICRLTVMRRTFYWKRKNL